jgi:hypothetical protein
MSGAPRRGYESQPTRSISIVTEGIRLEPNRVVTTAQMGGEHLGMVEHTL